MVYFINESGDPRNVGDMQLFTTKEELLYKHEPWYESVGHIVFDEYGNCYKMVAHDDYLTLKNLKSKVHPDSIEQCIKYFSSEQDTKPKLDMSLHPDQIKLIEDHHDYVVETLRPVKGKNFLGKFKFWK